MADDNTSAEITAKKQRVIGKPFPKGVSGNPDGRPVGSVSIVEGIRRKLLEVEPGTKKQYLELFLSSYFKNAIKDGDNQLMRDMINRIDGMPKQTTDLTTNGKEVNQVLVKFIDGSTNN
jgi:hypothetical protein